MIEDEITLQDKLEFFHLVFAEEFDSIFSADIICCEECVDEFIKYWPGVYINDQDFQTYSIQISSLYSMMRFSDFITEDEFNQFLSDLVCPRCNQKLRGIIYPYNMQFNEHPFALEVFQEITNISQTIDPEILSDAVYRARIFNNEIVYTAADFFAPPKEKVAEGRYNHAGKQVLYLSEEPETCFHELRSPQEGVMIANIRIKKPIKVLDLTMQSHESNIINLIRWSSLMSSPNEGEGWHKPHYVFTRFIADCAIAAGFHAIKYPSVRFDEGMNLALISYSEHINDFQVNEIFLFNDSNTKIEILKQRLMESLSS
ncbi:RES family NAD+ phosphorylase [Paenibacillus jilunlii]|uniref:RES domain-containing protein n=1 Tax=Paenibacillus jilunlii TaxID=682956 RepID=A0A1G9MG37_9BACL|nr:RES family NAD+ phosphorylase [Paenibacillus jilunlii]SDL72857.1 RES domain-containing protein [Paenibacillus jilunlii]